MKSVLSALLLGTAALSAVPAVAQDAPANNIVLVHGAFADETSWDKVAAILTAKGYSVTQVANPLTSLANDVAATKAVLDAQDGPTVLVAHSWGGVVIGEAGQAELLRRDHRRLGDPGRCAALLRRSHRRRHHRDRGQPFGPRIAAGGGRQSHRGRRSLSAPPTAGSHALPAVYPTRNPIQWRLK